MSCSLTIIAAGDGVSIRETLDSAVSLLRGRLQINAAAARVLVSDRNMATIVLHSPQDRDAALRILYKAGFTVTEGPAN